LTTDYSTDFVAHGLVPEPTTLIGAENIHIWNIHTLKYLE